MDSHGARRFRLPAAVVALLVLASGCSLSKGGHEYPSTAPSEGSAAPAYVALGDSYSTGGGIGTTVGHCLRSKAGYPTLLAKALKITAFEDESCGGATTGDLTEQMADLSASTKLVTLGIGTNDDGFATQIGYTCLKTKGKVAPACTTYLQTPAGDLQVTVGNLSSRLSSAIEAVMAAAPKATIVLVGYPRMLPDGATCTKRYPLDPRAVERLRTALTDVNSAWRSVARQEGITYVDTYAASEGHDICSADPWVNGLKPAKDDGASLHPNAAYHRAVAKLVEQALPANL
ncbi:MAG: SGNH/GDSL hydrolase family protein [Marmoricola sp.]